MVHPSEISMLCFKMYFVINFFGISLLFYMAKIQVSSSNENLIHVNEDLSLCQQNQASDPCEVAVDEQQ